MRDIYHHAYTVHFFNYVFSESTDSQSFGIITCRTANVIIPIVAECHIHHSAFSETLHITYILANGITILYSQHNGFLPFHFRISQINGRTVLGNHFFYFVQNAVGFCSSSRQCLVGTFRLFQVGYHDCGIQSAFRHLM